MKQEHKLVMQQENSMQDFKKARLKDGIHYYSKVDKGVCTGARRPLRIIK